MLLGLAGLRTFLFADLACVGVCSTPLQTFFFSLRYRFGHFRYPSLDAPRTTLLHQSMWIQSLCC